MRDKRRVCMRCAARGRGVECRVCGQKACAHLSTGKEYEDPERIIGINRVVSCICGPCKHSGAAARWWAEEEKAK